MGCLGKKLFECIEMTFVCVCVVFITRMEKFLLEQGFIKESQPKEMINEFLGGAEWDYVIMACWDQLILVVRSDCALFSPIPCSMMCLVA